MRCALPTELIDMSVVDGVGECCSPDLPSLYIDVVPDHPSVVPALLLLLRGRVQHLLHTEPFEEEASREEVQEDFLLGVLVRVDMMGRVNPGRAEGSWDGIS